MANSSPGAPSPPADASHKVLLDFVAWLCRTQPGLVAGFAADIPDPSSAALLRQLVSASPSEAKSPAEPSASAMPPPARPIVARSSSRDPRTRKPSESRDSSVPKERSRSPHSKPRPTQSVPSSSESEMDCDPSPSNDDSEGFTLKVSKKAKKRSLAKATAASNVVAPPAKAPKANAASTTAVAAATSDPTAAPSSSEQPRKERAPPPVFVQDKAKWENVSNLLTRNRVYYTLARTTQQGIKVQVPTAADHRQMTRLLRQEGISFHTYALEDQRLLRTVLRGIPKEVGTESILADLKSQNLPVKEVHRLHAPDKSPYDLVLVISELSKEGKAIFNISKVVGLSGISAEQPRRNGSPSQCHRCQLYGHSARFCFAKPRCVKCLGDHGTSECTRARDCPDPPSCVLCGTQGHTANYRGCPKAPRPNVKKTYRSFQRPATSNPRTQRVAPKVTLVPAPPPKTNAWAKPPSLVQASPKAAAPVQFAPAPAPTVGPYRPPPARAAAQAAQAPLNLGSSDLAADLALVYDYAQAVNMDEVRVFAHKLRSALTPDQRFRATLEHATVISAIQHYSLPNFARAI